MSGSMQGLGATGTGYQGQGGNSLLMQLIMQHMMSGGGSGNTGMGTGIANNPMSGVLQANRAQGMNPMMQMPMTGMQGANTGMSSMGGGNIQSLIQALQQQRNAQQGATNPYGTPNNPNLMQGVGNLLSGGSWTGSMTPQNLQQQMGLQSNQYVP